MRHGASARGNTSLSSVLLRRIRRLNRGGLLVAALGLTFVALLLLGSWTEEGAGLEPRADDITLVTHLSLDRWKALELILSKWSGPVAVAFWVKDLSQERSRLEEVVGALGAVPRVSYCVFGSPKYTYPANILRNRALQLADTKMVFLLDADFVPDEGLYGYLRSNLGELERRGRSAHVVPAFQFTEDNPSYAGQTDSFEFPRDKRELLEAVSSGRVVPMFQGIDETPSIRATDVERWYGASEGYAIRYEDDYEPYVVAPADLIPKYDERFLYYGYDKIQHIYHLHHLGFAFRVIPNHFIVHYPHHRSNWGKQQDKDAQKVKLLMQRFKEDLRKGRL